LLGYASSCCEPYPELGLLRPADSYSESDRNRQGVSNKCSTANLTALGGTNSVTGDHECRYIQSYYGDTDYVDKSVGFCLPVQLFDGTCSDFDYDYLKTTWNQAVMDGEMDPEGVWYDSCVLPGPDMMVGTMDDEFDSKCIGYYRGCIGLDTYAADLMQPTPGPGAKMELFPRLKAASRVAPEDLKEFLLNM
jgi:hypothetical protein